MAEWRSMGLVGELDDCEEAAWGQKDRLPGAGEHTLPIVWKTCKSGHCVEPG